MEERATTPAAENTAKGDSQRLRVTLVRSLIGYRESQRRTVKSLGLRRMHQSVDHYDSPMIQGMLRKVAHLVRVEKLAADEPIVQRETGTQRFQRRMEKKAAEMEALLAEFGLLGDDADLSSDEQGASLATPAATEAPQPKARKRKAAAGETADGDSENNVVVLRKTTDE